MKATKQYVCQNCGARYSKWAGHCNNCDAWNTIVEDLVVEDSSSTGKFALAQAKSSGKTLSFSSIKEIAASDEKERLKTEFGSLNEVLGGGILRGSVILFAGQPGIGKSTILMQICAKIANGHKVLYVSGEESAGQVKMRAVRLGANSETLSFAASTSGNDIAKTISDGEFDLVDVVLNFEGDRYGGFKTIRAVKNRFGSTSEAAIFEMTEKGLREVQNPSAALLAERQNTDGSIILATLEGTRPLLVEIQALVSTTNFGYPKRAASGFDLNRLNLLIAVIEQRTKLKLDDKDIFLNVVGGIKIKDSAADLAVCLAIASAAAGRKLSEEYVVFGEVGLGGEIRSAFRPDQRIGEAKKLGFKHAIAPATIHDKFVIPIKDLRTTLIKYVNE